MARHVLLAPLVITSMVQNVTPARARLLAVQLATQSRVIALLAALDTIWMWLAKHANSAKVLFRAMVKHAIYALLVTTSTEQTVPHAQVRLETATLATHCPASAQDVLYSTSLIKAPINVDCALTLQLVDSWTLLMFAKIVTIELPAALLATSQVEFVRRATLISTSTILPPTRSASSKVTTLTQLRTRRRYAVLLTAATVPATFAVDALLAIA